MLSRCKRGLMVLVAAATMAAALAPSAGAYPWSSSFYVSGRVICPRWQSGTAWLNWVKIYTPSTGWRYAFTNGGFCQANPSYSIYVSGVPTFGETMSWQFSYGSGSGIGSGSTHLWRPLLANTSFNLTG